MRLLPQFELLRIMEDLEPFDQVDPSYDEHRRLIGAFVAIDARPITEPRKAAMTLCRQEAKRLGLDAKVTTDEGGFAVSFPPH